MNRIKKWIGVLLTMTVLFTGCAPGESKDPVSSGGTGADDKPDTVPTINRTSFDQTTADGIMEIMQRKNNRQLEYGFNSRYIDYINEEDTAQKQLALFAKTGVLTSGDELAELASKYPDGGAVYLPAGEYTLSKAAVIPENILLVFEGGAVIKIASGATLTINGYVDAPVMQIFDGKVTGNSAGKGYPQWFGAKGNAFADDSAAVNTCVSVFATTIIPATANGYMFSDITVPDNKKVIGSGSAQVLIDGPKTAKTIFNITGSNVVIQGFEFKLASFQEGTTAILLNNGAKSLENIEITSIFAQSGYQIVADTGSGKNPITNVRLFDVDTRDSKTTPFDFKDTSFLYLRHCVADYNVLTISYKQSVTYPGMLIENCTGLLMEQCDVLGSYIAGTNTGHGFVLKNCAAVVMDRLYSDTLNGSGIVFDNVHYATVKNTSTGLNDNIGLVIENSSELDIELYTQQGRNEEMLVSSPNVDGISIKNSKNITFDNLQSICNTGNALVIDNSSGIVVTNFMTYINDGYGVLEKGSSNNNLIDSYTCYKDHTKPYQLVGAASGIRSLLTNDGDYGVGPNGAKTESVGSYSPAEAEGYTFSGDRLTLACTAFDNAAKLASDLRTANSNADKGAVNTSYAQELRGKLGKLHAEYAKNNVKKMGAKGDGKENDAAAFTAAFEQVKSGTLFVPAGTYQINSAFTVPAEITLVFEDGASLSIYRGVKVTVDGTIMAGPTNIFSGEGTITGSPADVAAYPQWFGAKGDGQTNDTTAFNKALSFFDQLYIPYTEKGYVVDELSTGAEVTIKGTGTKAPTLIATQNTKNLFSFRKSIAKIESLAFDMTNSAENSVCFHFDNANASLQKFRIKSIDAINPYYFVTDEDTYRKVGGSIHTHPTLVINVHFDNISITSPRASSFVMTDFYGFIFLRNILIDGSKYEGEMNYPAIEVFNNAGMIVEYCDVLGNTGKGSKGDGIVLESCWAVWMSNLTAKNLSGRGYVFKDLHHSYITDLTAENCAGAGVVSGGSYYQLSDLTVNKTSGIDLSDTVFATVSNIKVDTSDKTGIAIRNSSGNGLYNINIKNTEGAAIAEQGTVDYNRFDQLTYESCGKDPLISGKNSLMTKKGA